MTNLVIATCEYCGRLTEDLVTPGNENEPGHYCLTHTQYTDEDLRPWSFNSHTRTFTVSHNNTVESALRAEQFSDVLGMIPDDAPAPPTMTPTQCQNCGDTRFLVRIVMMKPMTIECQAVGSDDVEEDFLLEVAAYSHEVYPVEGHSIEVPNLIDDARRGLCEIDEIKIICRACGTEHHLPGTDDVTAPEEILQDDRNMYWA